ncbi:hypothetical protein BGY98DRAFT_1176673 [Russula aff. rugulosa BPL654]|nr:hypothetical protein BGY98DRAFT_1176673 [Russula aff. rugulosa BPL654]
MSQGNMYFTNAVLQLLVHCPPFGTCSMTWPARDRGEGQQTSGGTAPLVDATVRLLDDFAYKKEDDDTEPFTPMYVYDAMKEKRQFKRRTARDAEEYLGVYLDALEEELLALLASSSAHKPTFAAPGIEERKEGSQSGEGQTGVGKRDYISPISRIFDGRFRITCQDDTVKVESWRTLQLDIQPDSVNTVQDALAVISQPQSVQVETSDPSKASQQVTALIDALPPVLIVHLKRFSYDAATGGVVKNCKPIQFSPSSKSHQSRLRTDRGSVASDIMVPTGGRPAVPARYMLNGVLYHHGMSASGGHYTADVLHLNAHEGSGEAWLRIDDDIVNTVRHNEMFGRHDNERTDNRYSRSSHRKHFRYNTVAGVLENRKFSPVLEIPPITFFSLLRRGSQG